MLEVVSRRTPRQERHPLALVLGDVAQLFADQLGAPEIVLRRHQMVELRAFVGRQQSNLHTRQQWLALRRRAAAV